MFERDLVVVGAGPAGMSAAISAYENGVKDILVLERDQYLGGILNQCIHTGFGIYYFKELLTGPEYATRFIKKIKNIPSIEISLRSLVVSLTKDKVLTLLKPGLLKKIKARALIMATGAREKTREMVHISGSRPAGIFPAGLAQKLINIEGLLPGREAVVIGSGDIGLIMARRFMLEGVKVKAVIEIQKACRGLIRNAVQCLEDFDIPLYLSHKIQKISGKHRVQEIKVARVDENFKAIPGSEFKIKCDTILISVGLIPENELIEAAGVEMNKDTNSPVSDGNGMTSIPGLFSCGNSFKIYDLVDSVSRDSAIAGRLSAEYLKHLYIRGRKTVSMALLSPQKSESGPGDLNRGNALHFTRQSAAEDREAGLPLGIPLKEPQAVSLTTKNLICIECPKSCVLSAGIENNRVVKISGGRCPQGEKYAISEIERPLRILTATVLACGLSLKMIPVRTDQPIPKACLKEAMAKVKKIKIDKPLAAGDIVVKNFLQLGVNLVTTRDCLDG